MREGLNQMAVQCALEGCTEEIEQPERGPQRKFCCPAHRTAARSARLRSARSAPSPADTAATAAVLPTAPAETVEAAETPVEAVADETPVADDAAADEATPVESTLPAAEVAELPAEAPEPTPTARPTGAPDRVPPALRRQPVPLRRLRKQHSKRARAVVAGGLVVALAFGGGVSLLDRTQTPTPSAQPASVPVPSGQWLTDANVALASISQQLDQARASEARWTAAVGDARRRPSEVNALIERRQWLERQRLLLESQLAAWTDLQQAQAGLAMAQQRLADLDAATRGPTPVGVDLGSQRESAQRQVELLQQQVQALGQDVSTAAASPVPDTRDITAPLAEQVDELAQDPGRDTGPEGDNSSGAASTDPATVAREPESGDPAVALPETGEPPVRPSGGDGPAAATLPDFPEPVTAPVDEAAGAGGDTARDAGRSVGETVARGGDQLADAFPEPVSPSVSEPVRETTGALGDAVTGTTGAVGDLLDPPSGETAPSERPGRGGAPEEQDGPATPLRALDAVPFAGAVDPVGGLVGESSSERPDSSDDSGGPDRGGDGPRTPRSEEAVLPTALRPDSGGSPAEDDDEPADAAPRTAEDLVSRQSDERGGGQDREEGREDSRTVDPGSIGDDLREGIRREVTTRLGEALGGLPDGGRQADADQGTTDADDATSGRSSGGEESDDSGRERPSADDGSRDRSEDSSSDGSSSEQGSADRDRSEDSSSERSSSERSSSESSSSDASSHDSSDDSSSGSWSSGSSDHSRSESSSSDSSLSDSSSSDESSSDEESSDHGSSDHGSSDHGSSDSGSSDSGSSDSGSSDSGSSDSGSSDSGSSDSGSSDSSSSDHGSSDHVSSDSGSSDSDSSDSGSSDSGSSSGD
ncbi:hypothetical protein GCM10023200_48720 [Actinomycetospora chlora]|uniref:Uncharacterized protein n=1 Tax=Actinomycetospora chlora TaxID=663608 RepID=A0ABP9C712_9PSEU